MVGRPSDQPGGPERRMIVVDTSVWIDHLNNHVSDQVRLLRDVILDGLPSLIVGDLILCEVLQGLASDAQARAVEAALRQFDVRAMVDPFIASSAATNYRLLRRGGITVRKTMDVLIGTFCIEQNHILLHNDRDFDHLERHLGLRVLHP